MHDDDHDERLARYASASTALALLSDRRLTELVDAAPLVGSGIGGTSVALEIEGVPVFAKRVPLTDLERRPENVMSTANLFGLPMFCQYGIGAPGFGAWREMAANTMTTNWVLSGGCESFPLMYHWRVLPGPAPIELAGDEWQGSPAIRQRCEAITAASARVVLFLEHLPQALPDWLAAQAAAGVDTIEAACAMVERELLTAVPFMNAHGLLHFDAHFGNVLTDGRRLYLGDLGLATSPRFELSATERQFVADNTTHDRCHVLSQLVNWLVTKLSGAVDPAEPTWVTERNDYIRRCAEGEEPTGVPPAVAEIIKRYAPVVAVFNDFYWNLFSGDRSVRYPADEVQRALA